VLLKQKFGHEKRVKIAVKMQNKGDTKKICADVLKNLNWVF